MITGFIAYIPYLTVVFNCGIYVQTAGHCSASEGSMVCEAE